jgi:hypothetical protein
MKKGVLLVWLLCLTVGLAGCSGSKVGFRHIYQVGDTFHYQVTVETSGSMALSDGNQIPLDGTFTFQLAQEVTDEAKGIYTLRSELAGLDGIFMAAEVDDEAALAAIFKMNRYGMISDVDFTGDPAETDLQFNFGEMAMQNIIQFWRKPVDVGDSWTVRLVAPVPGMDAEITYEVKMTYVANVNNKGVETAKILTEARAPIHFNTVFEGNTVAIKGDTEVTGTYYVRKTNGTLVEGEKQEVLHVEYRVGSEDAPSVMEISTRTHISAITQ